MRKLLQTLWLPLIFLVIPLESEAQNGWVRYHTGYSFAINDVFFINNSTGWAVGGHYILKSTNGGVNWQRQADTNTFPQGSNLRTVFFVNESTGWAAGGAYTTFPFCIDISILLKTTNSGVSWFYQPSPSVDYNILYDVYATDPNNVFVCDFGTETFCIYSSGAVFRSSNGGSAWQNVTPEDNLFGFTCVSFIDPNTGWALGSKSGDTPPTITNVLKTTNGGVNWGIVSSDTVDFFGGGSGIQFLNSTTGYLSKPDKNLKTTNGGVNWFEFNPALNDSLHKFYFIDPNTGWAIGNGTGRLMKRTTDGGVTWVNQYTQGGLFFNLVSVFFTDELHGWVSSNNGYIYATTTGGVTSIQTVSSEIPSSFILHQNFPNPFNPETKIKFEIPLSVRGEKAEVRLSVYDVSGKEVRTLVNSELAAGVYEYSFDGAGLGSGVYFFKLQSGDFVETRRMVLVK